MRQWFRKQPRGTGQGEDEHSVDEQAVPAEEDFVQAEEEQEGISTQQDVTEEQGGTAGERDREGDDTNPGAGQNEEVIQDADAGQDAEVGPDADTGQDADIAQDAVTDRPDLLNDGIAANGEQSIVLRVNNVRRSFPVGGTTIQVLKGIDMEVPERQLVMLKGRSGSGKTTLLNMLGGLDQPTEGEIWFRDQPLHAWGDAKRTRLRRKQIGFVFQAYALLPLLSARENVELSLRMAGVPASEWKSRVTYCLELVGLGKRMNHRPGELSGGEQQRVAIAKAIAHRPYLLLADEPTANLDSQMGAQVMAVFRSIIESEGMTICMTTHDPTILEVADHVYEMVDGKFI